MATKLDWIKIVKEQESGWLVNSNMSVPNTAGNRHAVDILEWIAEGNTPEPEFTQEELDSQAQQVINSESLAYLASTDWYVIRLQETGVVIPQDILDARAEARLAIV